MVAMKLFTMLIGLPYDGRMGGLVEGSRLRIGCVLGHFEQTLKSGQDETRRVDPVGTRAQIGSFIEPRTQVDGEASHVVAYFHEL